MYALGIGFVPSVERTNLGMHSADTQTVHTDLTGVPLSSPQFSNPVATFLRIAALHLEITQPPVVEVVWS